MLNSAYSLSQALIWSYKTRLIIYSGYLLVLLWYGW